MHLLLSLILICSFFILIIAGLISVLRDMLRRDWPAAPAAAALDLDLPATSITRCAELNDHDLRGLRYRKANKQPARPPWNAVRLGDDQIPGGHEQRLIETMGVPGPGHCERRLQIRISKNRSAEMSQTPSRFSRHEHLGRRSGGCSRSGC